MTAADASRRLLEIVVEAHSRFFSNEDAHEVFSSLLADALEVCRCEYGFVGEVLYDDEGRPFLKTHAITDIAWDEPTRVLYAENARRGFEFRNLETLFGRVLSSGEMLVAHDAPNDPRRGGLPDGHPALRAFLGLPIRHDGELVGMIGMANREGGFDDDFTRFLEPLITTCGTVIAAYRADRRRAAAERALQDEETRLQAVLHTAVDGIATIDRSGLILSANPAAHRLFGYEDGELIGQKVNVLMHELEAGEHDGYLERYLRTRDPHVIGSNREVVARHRDGRSLSIELAVSEMRIEDDVQFVGLLRDVTQRRMIEEEVFATSTRLTALIDSLSEGILLETEDRRVALVNQQLCELFGIDAPPARLVGTDCRRNAELVAERFEDPEGFVERVEEVLRVREPVEGIVLRTVDGRVFECDYVPIVRAERYRGGLWQYRDVTARAAAAAALEASEARKSAVLDTALDCIITMDHEGRIVDFNPAAERTFGHRREDVVGVDLASLIVPERFREAHRAGMAHFLATGEGPVLGQRLELPALHAEGHEFPIELSINVIQLGDTSLFTAYLRDITARVAAEEELRKAKESAEEASRFKSDFLAGMSHEIRTPMTAIVGYSEMLSRGRGGPATDRETIGHIRRNADYLLALLNDVLDLSRIEAGQLKVDAEPMDVVGLVAGVASLMRPRAEERGLEFRVEFAGVVPRSVTSDAGRVRQILLNLVGNAIKFTDQGEISLRCGLTEDGAGEARLELAVADTGIGIPPENLPQLFDSFSQVHARRSRAAGGSGLGLAICRQLCDLLGAEIHVTSEPGEGSVFTVALPVTESEQAELVEEPSVEVLGPSEHPRRSAVRLDGVSVLVVDDSRDNRRIARYLLEEAGCRVVEAADGQRGVDAVLDARLRGAPFDVVLMDMQMPVLDGYGATGRLRSEGVRTPIVAVTAFATADDRRKCLDAGCDDYLSKPLVPGDLIRLVRSLAGETVAESSPQPEAAQTGGPPMTMGAPGETAAGLEIDEGLRRRLDNPAFVAIVEDYLASLPGIARALSDQLADEDWGAISQAVHRLRGTGGSFGLIGLSRVAGACEDALRHDEPADDVRVLVAETIESLHAAAAAGVEGLRRAHRGRD